MFRETSDHPHSEGDSLVKGEGMSSILTIGMLSKSS